MKKRSQVEITQKINFLTFPTGVEPMTFQNTGWTELWRTDGEQATLRPSDLARHQPSIAQWLERLTGWTWKEGHGFHSCWETRKKIYFLSNFDLLHSAFLDVSSTALARKLALRDSTSRGRYTRYEGQNG